MTFNLQFPPAQIQEFAANFGYLKSEAELSDHIKPLVRQRGYLTLNELKTICLWKSERSKSRVARNLPEDVEELTKVCFEIQNEKLRIGSLLLLNGVEFPTASVILHFFHPEPYPILDYRALEALGVQKPAAYTFDFWMHYVTFTRQLASKHKVDMRTLDKALWQWSKQK